MRWFPFPLPQEENVDFVNGLKTICGAGEVFTRNGLAVYVYACNNSMTNKAFYSADGDFLIGRLKSTMEHLLYCSFQVRISYILARGRVYMYLYFYGKEH